LFVVDARATRQQLGRNQYPGAGRRERCLKPVSKNLKRYFK
jgi:hypothetical protein